MELDDLKQLWKQSPEEKNPNNNIMELIQHKSYGPVAALKKVFRKQIAFMAVIPAVLILTNINDVNAVFTSIMFWSYVAFCIGVVVFAYYNYRIVTGMENMDAMVKDNLRQQIYLLEKRMKWEILGLRCALLFFITLTEVVPYIQHYRTLDYWHNLSPFIRFGTYAALLVLQFFLNRKISERKVGAHIAYLKTLVSEMQ